jgi:hypothetical protein
MPPCSKSIRYHRRLRQFSKLGGLIAEQPQQPRAAPTPGWLGRIHGSPTPRAIEL